MAIVSYGTITITDTNDIESIVIEYARNQSSSSAPESGWSTNRPAWAQGYYIWQRTRTHKAGTDASKDTYGTAVCITGSTGATGATGQSLSSTKTQYTNVASNVTITTNNHTSYTWTDNVPAYNSSKPAYWARVTNIYTNPAKTEYLVYKDQGITDAIKTSYDANTKADDALDKAGQALNNTSTLQTRLKYFWRNLTTHTKGNDGWTKPNYPVGTYAASGIDNVTFDEEDSSTYGYNTLYANGIKLRYNAINLGQLTGSSLIFYNPSTTSQGTKAMELSGSALKFYASDGATAQAEFGGTKARVSGTIEALDGKIGNNSNNYWYIGNYVDYNQNQSAAIKSYGTAFIQLGDNNTWRLATNRFHSAWNDDSSGTAGQLHYPVYDSKYWDSGLHLPTSSTDKFLYIRNAPNTQSLENLQNDLEDSGYDYWTYQFYIDGAGNLHAGDIYSHDTLISGASAPYLLKSGGTMTGSITMSNGGKFIGNLTGNADTASNASKVNGLTVQTAVPANALFTDKNVQTSQANTTKLYLVGTSTTATNTGTLNFDSNIYADTTAGALYATTFNGYTLAAASAKGVVTSVDTSANLPTSNAVKTFVENKGYLTSVTLSQDSDNGHTFSITESGGSAQTITIPDNNTTYTFSGGTNGFTVTPSGGSAQTVTVTPSISNNITGSGTSEYLAKFTGTNTIGNGPAIGTGTTKFLREDGTWVVPAGTGVTSVAASGNNGISISGSPITTSGTITIGLNLSTAINGLGEGTSAAQRDDYIVAQYAGGGTTTTTYHRRKLSNIFAALNSSDITTALGFTPTANTGTVTSVKVQGSNGLTGSGTITTSGTITISHADTSSQDSITESDRTYIKSVTLDGYGHVTGLTTGTETVTNTHNTAYLYAGASDGTANAATTNGNTYLILMDGGSATTRRKVSGSGTVSVASDSSGNITITGSAHPTSLKNPNALTVKIYNGSSTSSNTSYDGSTANQSVSVAGTNAITGINSTTDGKLQLTLADGSQPDPISVKITATTSDSAASADKLNLSANVGSSTQPVYFNANTGLPVAISYTIQSNVPQNAKFTDTWTAMVGATSNANGSVGYVNAVPPKDGYNTKFLRADGTWVVPGGTYSLPLAANGTRGGVQIGYTQSGKNYPVQLSSEKMYVNVPWENTTYTFDGTYNASSNKAATVSTVTGAINALDVTAITGTAGQTITSISETDGKISATYSNISITKSQISDFPSSMTPTAHTHDDRYYTETEIDTRLKKYINRVHFGSQSNFNNKYFKISINSYTSWMLNFTVKLYQGYKAYDLQISGYNYGSNYWYSPAAIILGANSTSTLDISFGYDSSFHLWIAIPGNSYTGIDIIDAVNGYTQLDNLEDLFTIETVDALPSTVQSTITAYRPWYRNETVSNATSATSATSAGKWTTARDFTIKDSDSTNSGTSASVNGSSAVTLLLPSTIKASLTGNASTATKLANARTIQTNLASTSSASFDGSSNITPGVTGTLAVGNGGTGQSSFTANSLIMSGSTTTGAFTTRGIRNNTSVSNLGWTSSSADVVIPTVNTIAYWNGAYSGTSSNLTYCIKGAFGTAATYTATTSVANNSNLPTGAAIQTYVTNQINNASSIYVTLNTLQNITENKIFSAGTKWTTETGTTPTKYGACSYDSTLDALIFSFG